MPSFSGENLFCVPKTKPATKTYVRKLITGMYKSGALMLYLAGVTSPCWSIGTDQSYIQEKID